VEKPWSSGRPSTFRPEKKTRPRDDSQCAGTRQGRELHVLRLRERRNN